jgi:hypothetical protein
LVLKSQPFALSLKSGFAEFPFCFSSTPESFSRHPHLLRGYNWTHIFFEASVCAGVNSIPVESPSRARLPQTSLSHVDSPGPEYLVIPSMHCDQGPAVAITQSQCCIWCCGCHRRAMHGVTGAIIMLHWCFSCHYGTTCGVAGAVIILQWCHGCSCCAVYGITVTVIIFVPCVVLQS